MAKFTDKQRADYWKAKASGGVSKSSRSDGKKVFPSKRKGYRQSEAAQQFTVKGLMNTYSLLKSDTILGATANVTPTNAPNGSNTWRWNAAMNLWSPSFRPLAGSVRTSSECLFVGVREHLQVRVPIGVTCALRRVVFVARHELQDGLPHMLQAPTVIPEGGAMIFRPINNFPLGETRSGPAANADLTNARRVLSSIMKGTLDTDYTMTTASRHPLDSNMVKVLSDKIHRSPTAPCFWEKRFWHPVNEIINYSDKENGINKTDSGWASVARGGVGNVYVLTFFEKEGGTGDESSPTVCYNTAVYWREKKT